MTTRERVFAKVKKCVTFVYYKKGESEYVPIGTGFFVGVKPEGQDKFFQVYLVTARHVITDQNGNFFDTLLIRLNTKDGNSKLIQVARTSTKIFEHQDNTVDLAVIPMLPDQNLFDFLFLTHDMIATQKIITETGIGEGDDVFFSGLFTPHVGQQRIQPIVRFGKVALLSDEKVQWPEKGKPMKMLDLYLLECQSFGGNSGSPVFFQLSPTREPGVLNLGPSRIYLAGVMMGSFLDANEIAIANVGKPSLFSLQNVGIAAVTPAYKLYEILFSKELIELRKLVIASRPTVNQQPSATPAD